jgi:spermidine synthase
LALVGVVYELGFAQILSATLGNTYLRYTTTIGLFTLTLGTASLLYDRYKFSLSHLQVALFAVGFAGPFFIMGVDPARYDDSWNWLCQGLSYVPILLVGFISGFELPLLMDQDNEKAKSFTLAFDYFGMFAGTLIFPLFLLPTWGVNGSLWAAAVLNGVAFFYLLIQRKIKS